MNGVINEVKCEDEIKLKLINKNESLERYIAFENIKQSENNEIDNENEEKEEKRRNTFKLMYKYYYIYLNIFLK